MRTNKSSLIKIAGVIVAICFALHGCGGGSSSTSSTPAASESQSGSNSSSNATAGADTEVTCNGACITVSADADTSSD